MTVFLLHVLPCPHVGAELLQALDATVGESGNAPFGSVVCMDHLAAV